MVESGCLRVGEVATLTRDNRICRCSRCLTPAAEDGTMGKTRACALSSATALTNRSAGKNHTKNKSCRLGFSQKN